MRFAICLLPLLLGSCNLTGNVSSEERAWTASPDGQTHAILIETNGGATTAYGYLVELHPSDHQGEKPVRAAKLYRVASDCEFGPAIHWRDADTLTVGFETAQQIQVNEEVTVGRKKIHVIVDRTLGDPAKPCKGMIGRGRKT